MMKWKFVNMVNSDSFCNFMNWKVKHVFVSNFVNWMAKHKKMYIYGHKQILRLYYVMALLS